MSNRITQAPQALDFPGRENPFRPGWTQVARDTASGFITTARHAVTVFGLIAIAALALMFVKPDLADDLKALSPFAVEDSESLPDLNAPTLAALPAQTAGAAPLLGAAQPAALKTGAPTPAISAEQQRVASWLSRRYRVASDATAMLVGAAYRTANEIKLDPLLILSVMAIESGFNPFAESPVGAKGLMQVMAKLHHDKFQPLGGVKAALNPLANIRVGSLILKDYVTRGGSVEAGLKMYVGAGNLDTDFGYGAKVLAEYHRLKEVAMGKNVSVYASADPKPAPAQPKAATVDLTAPASEKAARSEDRPEQLAAL